MIDLIQPYIGIATKLIVGMLGILAFLRITGKAQMGQLTPLDTVSRWCVVQSRHDDMASYLCLCSVDRL